MALVNSSEKSSHFGRKEQHIYPVRKDPLDRRPSKVKEQSDATNGSQNLDNLDLSPAAINMFISIEKSFSKLFEEFPEHKENFMGENENPVRRGIFLMSRSKQFLNDPMAVQRGLEDIDFHHFYEKIQKLHLENDHAHRQMKKNLHPQIARYHH